LRFIFYPVRYSFQLIKLLSSVVYYRGNYLKVLRTGGNNMKINFKLSVWITIIMAVVVTVIAVVFLKQVSGITNPTPLKKYIITLVVIAVLAAAAVIYAFLGFIINKAVTRNQNAPVINEITAGNISALKEASEAGRTGLQEMSADIQEIARESEGLLAINSVMQHIARQTNLLSMNAVVEAAHAGEAGKGFAVVAGEIHRLAESSGEQSQTVGAVLKDIKDSIKNITRSAENILSRFEAIDLNAR
jgi:hypothetical protein